MRKGYTDVLIGLQFGDEGKARVVDMIAKQYNVIARFNGGANAGHTIDTKKGKIALKQIPSGIFYPNILLYIGSGCVVNIVKLCAEIAAVEELGIQLTNRLHINSQASIIQPHHVFIDEIIGQEVGTTKNGIGPAYGDKAIRMKKDMLVNIRLADLLEDTPYFLNILKKNLVETVEKYALTDVDVQKTINELASCFEKIKKYIQPDPLFLQRKVEQGAKVLFEGAQSVMLDISKGSVPYVTSSNTVAAAAYVGGDVSVDFHRKTIGVAKAVMSRVGYGPFPSEYGGTKSETYCMAMTGNKPTYGKDVEKTYDVKKLLASEDEFEMGKALRVLSGEYGTVTTRPRRIGMLDAIQLSYAVSSNGVNEIILNKCDLLREFADTKKKKIPTVTGYSLDGKKISYFPASIAACKRVKTTVSYFEPFSEDVSTIRTYSKLPKQLQNLIAEIEKQAGAKITGVGVGPQRDQFVWKK
ncbi:MAG: adenylosuccinate synthetase [Candidatus Levyibacteriota bacterium]